MLDKLKNENSNKRIKFYGKLDFDKLCELYAYNDIFVYAPNWPEGLPTSILEAGLMGNSVITSLQGGIKEIINDGINGLIVNDEDELLYKLEYLILHKDIRLKLSKQLKEKILNNFEWGKTSDKIINDLYKEN